MDHGMGAYSQVWWEKLKREMSDVGQGSASDIRNDMAHAEFVTEERGSALLRMMFNGTKSIFNRCQSLHDEAKRRSII